MKKRQKHEISTKTDVIPIINVSLVVVLTLMIISPFLNESELPVELPEATTSETEDQDKIEIIMGLDGSFAVDDQVVEPDALRGILEASFGSHPNWIAVLKADKGIAYGEVEKIIAMTKNAGAARIAVATEQIKQGAE